MKRLFFCFMLLVFYNCSTLPKHYVATGSGDQLSLEEILEQVEDQRVIFVGEIHTDAASHDVQFEIVRHLVNKGKRVSIAIEIFPSASQDDLDRWNNGHISKKDFVRLFRSNVNLPFEIYEEIFDFARIMDVPVFGLDAGREFISNVSKNGIKTVPEDLLKKIGFSDCSEDPEYMEILGLSGERDYHQSGMPFLCDGQRLRDTIMAFNISEILKRKEGTVVVLLGMVHASKIAVPFLLEKYTEVPYKVLMPDTIKHIIKRNIDADVADYIWY